MVRYVRDNTGRFPERPHYDPAELDSQCEQIVCTFLKKKYGSVEFPISTEDLKIMIEQDVESLDCYADLSEHGPDVDGITEFRPGKKPIVKISQRLEEDERYENRLRTTLTHEYGHVRFHSYLFTLRQDQGQLFQAPQMERLISKRENIIGAQTTDWMEWQAGYVCGSILMPKSYLIKAVATHREKTRYSRPFQQGSTPTQALITMTCENFQVSSDAARVRLSQLAIVTTSPSNSSSF